MREGTTPNILHKSIEKLEDFQKVFEESKIYCDYCKEEFGQNAILIHISKNKDCKSHYGPTYDKIKLIMKKYILLKKKEKYDTDQEVREKMKKSSKKAHQKFKEEKAKWKEKKSKEFQKKEAEFSIGFHEEKGRQKNSTWRKKLGWVIDCFHHFFENFSQIDIKVKAKMLDIEDNVNDLYQKIENRIDEVVARLDNCNDHVKVQQLFSENNLTKTDIQNEWWKYEQYNLGKKLENILEDVEEIDRSQDWYPIVEKIQERFKDRFTPRKFQKENC